MPMTRTELAPVGALAALREWIGPGAAAPPEPGPRPTPRPAAHAAASGRGVDVQVRQLVRRYGERVVLDGVDLDLAPGEFVAVVGRSGCGKSTLLRQVAGLEPADGGSVRIGGRPAGEARGDLRLMFQDARLLPWKRVLDNVALGLPGPRAAARRLAQDALAQVGLAERGDDWPAQLSGGQRQRVALARALVHRPRLLLLDEPLGALDALTRVEMQQLIERLWRSLGFTALLVTHDVGEAVALADRIVLVEGGDIAVDAAVPLPRPRARGDAAFAALEDRVLRRVLAHPAPPADAPPPSRAATGQPPAWAFAV